MINTFSDKPWKTEDVFLFFQTVLKAVPIPKSEITFYNEKQNFNGEKILACFCIYDRAILAILAGEIPTIHHLEYQLLAAKRKSIDLTDVDTLIDIGAIVIVETIDGISIASCHISFHQSLFKMYHFIELVKGLPNKQHDTKDERRKKEYSAAYQSIHQTGLLDIFQRQV